MRRLIEVDNASGHYPALAGELRNPIAVLQDIERKDELRLVLVLENHQLTGALSGHWSLHVSKNLHRIFRVDRANVEIIDPNYQDHH